MDANLVAKEASLDCKSRLRSEYGSSSRSPHFNQDGVVRRLGSTWSPRLDPTRWLGYGNTAPLHHALSERRSGRTVLQRHATSTNFIPNRYRHSELGRVVLNTCVRMGLLTLDSRSVARSFVHRKVRIWQDEAASASTSSVTFFKNEAPAGQESANETDGRRAGGRARKQHFKASFDAKKLWTTSELLCRLSVTVSAAASRVVLGIYSKTISAKRSRPGRRPLFAKMALL